MTETETNEAPPATQPPHFHHGFISYQKSSSLRQARALQSALEGIARRSQTETKLDLFRDETGLSIADLDETLGLELEGSRRLIAILHRETVESRWVDREIEHWLASGHAPDHLVLVRIDPALDLTWDETSGGFARPEMLPSALRSCFVNEPLWLDLSEMRRRRFRDPSSQLPRLCATLLERPPEELLQRELRAQRRRQGILSGAVLLLASLLVLAIVASIIAVNARDLAQEREKEARAQAEAAEALLVGSERPEHSMQLLVDATSQSDSQSVRAAVYSVLEQNDRLQAVLPSAPSLGVESPGDLAFSPSGKRLVAWRVAKPSGKDVNGPGRISFVAWDLERRAVASELQTDGLQVQEAEPVGESRVVYCGSDGIETVDLDKHGSVPRDVIVDGKFGRTSWNEVERCFVSRLHGGVFALLRRKSTEAQAVIIGDNGFRRVFQNVTRAGAPEGSDVAFVGDYGDDEVHAISADGKRDVVVKGLGHRGFTPLADAHDSSMVVRTDNGSVLLAEPFAPTPAATELDDLNGARAVAELPSSPGSFLWLDAGATLHWSKSDQTVDLSDLTDGSPMDQKVEPAIWVNDYGSTAVVAYQGKATTLELTTSSPTPSIKRGQIVSLSAFFANRTRLMAARERGRNRVFLPAGDNRFVSISSGGKVDNEPGVAFHDPSGRTAIEFGGGKLRLFPITGDVEDVLKGDPTTAVALSGDGTRFAVVRPGAVELYSAEDRKSLASLIKVDEQVAPRTVARFGTVVVRSPGDGRVVLEDRNGTNQQTFDQFTGRYDGIEAVSPDGNTAVVALSIDNSQATEGSYEFMIASRDGKTQPVDDKCHKGSNGLRFVPGKDFRTNISAGESPHLARSIREDDGINGGQTGNPAYSCDPAVFDDQLLSPRDLLDYQLDDVQGRIVARSPDGGVDVTTWRRGDAASLRSVRLPSVHEKTVISVDPASNYVTEAEPNGSVSLLRLHDGAFSIELVVQTDLGDVAAALPFEHLQLLSVVGKNGQVEVFDMSTGRMLFKRSVSTGKDGVGKTVTALGASADESDGNFIVNVSTGPSTGLANGGGRVTAPMRTEVLRARLCEIHPTAEHC